MCLGKYLCFFSRCSVTPIVGLCWCVKRQLAIWVMSGDLGPRLRGAKFSGMWEVLWIGPRLLKSWVNSQGIIHQPHSKPLSRTDPHQSRLITIADNSRAQTVVSFRTLKSPDPKNTHFGSVALNPHPPGAAW